jgi:hypothetical protein
MGNNDVKWIKDLVGRYEWPEPSSNLKRRILTQSVGVQVREIEESFVEYVLSFLQPKMASAMACMLILGLCFGALAVPKSSAQAHVSNIYMDTDLMLIQSIIEQTKGRYND